MGAGIEVEDREVPLRPIIKESDGKLLSNVINPVVK
jgi:hypothetical protein